MSNTDDFHAKLAHLVGELHSLVQSSSTNADEHGDNSAELMDAGPDEGDPGINDSNEPEGDSKPFAEGAHDKHVGADFGGSSHEDSGDKETKKGMLLALLKKHG